MDIQAFLVHMKSKQTQNSSQQTMLDAERSGKFKYVVGD